MIYTNISRGLFEADKLIFSFLITTSINKNAGKIAPSTWGMLLRGAIPLTNDQAELMPPNPDPKLIPKLGWELLYSADLNVKESFGTITDSVINDMDIWYKWITCDNPHQTDLPLQWNESLTRFEKLIVLKAFRPEKIMFAFIDYVQYEMGKFYIESPAITLDIVYADTDQITPLVFILSPGADPTQMLLNFAA